MIIDFFWMFGLISCTPGTGLLDFVLSMLAWDDEDAQLQCDSKLACSIRPCAGHGPGEALVAESQNCELLILADSRIIIIIIRIIRRVASSGSAALCHSANPGCSSSTGAMLSDTDAKTGQNCINLPLKNCLHWKVTMVRGCSVWSLIAKNAKTKGNQQQYTSGRA